MTPAENRSLGRAGLFVLSLGTLPLGVDGYVLSGLLPHASGGTNTLCRAESGITIELA